VEAERAAELIKANWRALWAADKGRGKKAGVICPHCGNGGGSEGDGVKPVKGEGVVLHCFKCGFTGSAVELLGLELNAPVVKKTDAQGKPALRVVLRGDDYKRAIEEGARRLALSVEWGKYSAGAIKPHAPVKAERKVVKPMQEEVKQDFSAYCEKMRAGLKDERAAAYLSGRGISIETAARLGVGFDSAWKNPKGGKIASPRIILPFAGGCGYLARALNDEKGCKQNGGAVGLFNAEALQGGGVCFVVEGWADAASIEETGRRAVALNGAANVNILLDAVADFDGVLILALDSDDGGQRGTETIKTALQEAGVSFIVGDACGGFKDENEFLSADREGFDFCLMELEAEGRAAAEKAASPDSLFEYVKGGAWREDVERGAKNREKTGFPALDDWLGGGLYEGLTVLSGFPSLGKTSLIWQIAENIAAAGCHVIFFSLEMGKADMLAKSLSRRAYQNGRDVTSDDAESGRDECERELEELFADVGARFECVEGSFGYGIEKIYQKARRAKKHCGGRLAVFVDYLQAAADYGGKAETAAISDTAKAFRQMARDLHCPVVCASSVARSGYDCAVGFSSFYGSSGIESAADCAAGLQLSAVYSREYKEAGRDKVGGKEKQAEMIDKSKKALMREVSFIGMKNRRGEMGCKIDFVFDVKHCNFKQNGVFCAAPSSDDLSAADIESLLEM